MINKNKLKLYLQNNFNVLMSGRHGVGKTAVIKDVFENENMNWRYFSAATMDPWVDFIGVPKSVADENGQETLELVKPKDFALDNIEALFFDEFNRAHPKVMNAVMELIQFKSINGHKLNNLKVVWAAVNPWDEENTYDVDPIDPAVKDRFHVYLDIPYKIDSKYFLNTYGVKAQAFIDWWEELPDNIKDEVSPRRVEYALKINEVGGSLNDVLPSNSNIKKLKTNIQRLNKHEELINLTQSDPETIKQQMTLDNTKRWFDPIIQNPEFHGLIPYFSDEFIDQAIEQGDTQTTQKINKALEQNKNKKNPANKKEGQKLQQRIEEAEQEIKKNNLEQFKKDFIPNLEQAIDDTSAFASAKTFAKNIAPTYIEFCQNNNEENYFDYLFQHIKPNSVHKAYQMLVNKPHTGNSMNNSTFLPNVKSLGTELNDLNKSLSMFLGMLYQNAYLYQKNNSFYNNNQTEAQKINTSLDNAVSDIKQFLNDQKSYGTIKNTTMYEARALYFAYGFSQAESADAGKQIKISPSNMEKLNQKFNKYNIQKLQECISEKGIIQKLNSNIKNSVADFESIADKQFKTKQQPKKHNQSRQSNNSKKQKQGYNQDSKLEQIFDQANQLADHEKKKKNKPKI